MGNLRILITGSNGLLGQKIVKQLIAKQIDFLATSKGENRNTSCQEHNYQSLDIERIEDIESIFSSYQPSHVIHTAAITNVDYCEQDPELCYAVNVNATKLLLDAAISIDAHFLLLSTDCIFDGLKGDYLETDAANPLSHYAHSKWEAELLLHKGSYSNWSIVRTIIVYGDGENLSRSNLISWAKESLKKGEKISVIDDQFRAPTWAEDLAWACIRICKLNKLGVYNACGPETLSIYEIVCRIARFYKFDATLIQRSNSKLLNQAAQRPPRTGLNLNKSSLELGYAPKTIEETLDLLK